MPILSNKHVINISFKHVDTDEDGNEFSTDVSAFLENGIMKVKFKSGNKFIVLSLDALKEITNYISTSIPQMSKDEKSNAHKDSIRPDETTIPANIGISGALESAIFGSSMSGINGGSNAINQPTYASPTMIAASASAIHQSVENDRNTSWNNMFANSNSEEKTPVKKKTSKIKSLNLSRDDRTDEEGRFVIDLNESEESN